MQPLGAAECNRDLSRRRKIQPRLAGARGLLCPPDTTRFARVNAAFRDARQRFRFEFLILEIFLEYRLDQTDDPSRVKRVSKRVCPERRRCLVDANPAWPIGRWKLPSAQSQLRKRLETRVLGSRSVLQADSAVTPGRPVSETSKSSIVVVAERSTSQLAHCRPGASSWTGSRIPRLR